MAIKIYSGRPRHGKSYNSVANVIIPSIKSGRTVVTNVVLNKDVIFSDFPDANIITIPFDIDYSSSAKYFNRDLYPAGSVYVIDEGAKLFPTGLKVQNVPSSLLLFFSEHGHSVGADGYASEIFVLCQDNSQLAKFIRDLVDTTYHHVKLDKHGFSDRFRVDIYDGSVNASSTNKKPLESKVGAYSSDIYKYYKSHTQKSELADTALEVSPDKRGSGFSIYRNAVIALLLLIPLVYFAYSSLTSLFGSDDLDLPSGSPSDSTHETPQPVVSSSSTSDIASSLTGRLDPYNLSDDWRLSGIISTPSGLTAIIESEDRSRFLDVLTFCDYDRDLSEWYCLLNNEVVASYTGPVYEFDPDESVLPFTD